MKDHAVFHPKMERTNDYKEVNFRKGRIPNGSTTPWEATRGIDPQPDWRTSEDFGHIEREEWCNRLMWGDGRDAQRPYKSPRKQRSR
jgi:hypothetical protein